MKDMSTQSRLPPNSALPLGKVRAVGKSKLREVAFGLGRINDGDGSFSTDVDVRAYSFFSPKGNSKQALPPRSCVSTHPSSHVRALVHSSRATLQGKVWDARLRADFLEYGLDRAKSSRIPTCRTPQRATLLDFAFGTPQSDRLIEGIYVPERTRHAGNRSRSVH